MIILEVNYDEIQKAMEDIRRDRLDYYLDMKTGKVIALAEDFLDDTLNRLYHDLPDDDPDSEVLFDSELNTAVELPAEMYDSLETALEVLPRTDRYLRIPERNRTEAFACMKTFAEGHTNNKLRSAMLRSLDGVSAFRKFKNSMKSYPEERRAWNRYNAKKMKKIIKGWLNSNGIHPVRKRGSNG